MSKKSWHNFKPKEEYARDYVVAVCEDHINKSGQVGSPEQKLSYLEQIRNSPFQKIIYSPRGKGWNNSPMNPQNWQKLGGGPIGELKGVPKSSKK